MSVLPFYSPRFRAFDANGNPLAGGLLYTYAAGTSTPQATYTTRAGTTPNANPVVLDANGEANIWASPGVAYKYELRNSAGVVQWTVDNVPTPADMDTLADGSLRLPDGTVGAPSLSFTNDTDTGLYRIGANNPAMSVGTTKVQDWTVNGSTITGDLSVTDDVDITGGLTVQGGAAGGVSLTGQTANPCYLASGTNATAAAPQNAAELTNGNLRLSGANPNADVAFTEVLTPNNIPKAWAHVTTTNATPFVPTLNAGFNITSVARVDANTLRVTFASAFASVNFAPVVSGDISVAMFVFAKTTTTVDIRLVTGALDSPGQPVQFFLVVFGAQ